MTFTTKKSANIAASLFFLFALTAAAKPSSAEELTISPDAQKSVSITIYNRDLALVRDVRRVKLPGGELELAYSGISAEIKPETALFKAEGISILDDGRDGLARLLQPCGWPLKVAVIDGQKAAPAVRLDQRSHAISHSPVHGHRPPCMGGRCPRLASPSWK